MKSNVIGRYHLLIAGILSSLRISSYIYWIYWFREFILPVIFITEQGLFLMTQLPLILAVLDTVLVLSLLLTKGRTWSFPVVGSIAAVAYSYLFLFSFSDIAGVIGLVLVVSSFLQLAMLIYVYFQFKQQ